MEDIIKGFMKDIIKGFMGDIVKGNMKDIVKGFMKDTIKGFMKDIIKGYERLLVIMKGWERCSKMRIRRKNLMKWFLSISRDYWVHFEKVSRYSNSERVRRIKGLFFASRFDPATSVTDSTGNATPSNSTTERVEFLGANWNQTKISIWIYTRKILRNLSFSIWWTLGM